MSLKARQLAYAVAFSVGLVVPFAVFAPWLVDHGLDVPLLTRQLFATRVSSFFAVDVIVAVLTLLVVVAIDDELPARHRIAVAIASLLGASVGLPLLLLLRERVRTRARSEHVLPQ